MNPEAKHSGISIITVANEKDIVKYGVDELSMELTGQNIQRVFPIYLVVYEGQIQGCLHAVQQLVIYPAFRTGKMRPAYFIRMVANLIREFKRMAANPIFMACSEIDKMSPRHLELLRLKKAPETAFLYHEYE